MNESNMKYFMKLHPAHESLELLTAHHAFDIIEPTTMNVFGINFGKKKRITNCNPKVQRMTPCVRNVYEEMFGVGYQNIVMSSTNFSFTSFTGMDGLQKG